VWTENDDKDVAYGKWHCHTAKATIAELQKKVHPPKTASKIWPHWSEGVPTTLRQWVYLPRFL
jgi:hypothetical protein